MTSFYYYRHGMFIGSEIFNVNIQIRKLITAIKLFFGDTFQLNFIPQFWGCHKTLEFDEWSPLRNSELILIQISQVKKSGFYACCKSLLRGFVLRRTRRYAFVFDDGTRRRARFVLILPLPLLPILRLYICYFFILPTTVINTTYYHFNINYFMNLTLIIKHFNYLTYIFFKLISICNKY